MTAKFKIKESYTMEDLLSIVELLRSENGCPWDKVQTHDTIKNNLLEETYEAYEAIVLNDMNLLKEELGDVLLQVVFHAQIEKEKQVFNFDDICNDLCCKLVERHPHVFGDVQAATPDKALDSWDEIKKKQKKQTTVMETLEAVPKVFPALMRAQKVQKRAAKSGFDYPDTAWAMKDLQSEVLELVEAIDEGDKDHMEEELGDLLFSAVNVARFIDADAEETLMRSTKKFMDRFGKVEAIATEQGLDMQAMTMDELDKLWKMAKKI